MKTAMVFAATLLVAATPVQAEDWWFTGYVGKPTERIVYFADADVNDINGYKHLWTERVLEKDGARGEALVKSLFVFDCGQRRFAEMEQLLFDREWESLPRARLLPEWTFVPPSSIAASLMRFACLAERPIGSHVGGQSRQAAAVERVFQLGDRAGG